ncbi:hypothetical protein AB4Y96_12275 [Phyllobacterium sp. TAF24]|uniref:hypothetical protein n=1 Tax=Phyllobacterium sp. TAF24 TaxID=3233068 RepID=UPI003F98774D
MQYPYINSATESLVTEIRDIIHERQDLSDEEQVLHNFKEFSASCSVSPLIVEYIANKISRLENLNVFSDRQLEVLMLGMIARSSSTYGTIPNVVAHLALIGEHAEAAILNENAKNETGDRAHKPHPTLLYDCFAVIGRALSIPVLTPASYHILRQILIERERTGQPVMRTVDSVNRHFAENDLHIPDYTDDDIRVAIYYTERCNSSITHLHSRIIEIESRMNDRGGGTEARNPYDKKWLAIRRLELAMREASSVDDHDTNQLSYIGAWGQVVEHLVPQLPPSELVRARAWTEAHNDEHAGQAIGWGGAAEEGHAEDARIQAVRMMKTLKPLTFATALREVTAFNVVRLGFWSRIVDALKDLEHSNKMEQSEAPNPLSA